MALKQIAIAVGFFLLTTVAHAQTNRDGDRMAGQISVGFDGQNYSSGRTSTIGSLDATIRLLPRLTLDAMATGGSYFGERFGGGGSYVTLKLDRKTYLTAGGSLNSNTGTTNTWSGSFELGRTLYQSERDPLRRASVIRALETNLNLTDRGYNFSPAVNVLLVSPGRPFIFREIGASRFAPARSGRLSAPQTRGHPRAVRS
jgi:hypothetical protein